MLDIAEGPRDGVEGTPVPRTAYDSVAYMSHVIRHLDPDRLGVIARLHGIEAPAIATARVLEIGGGDGQNLTAFAAAFPRSQCLCFDLASTAVGRGRALATAAGIDNLRVERLDILDAAESLAGEYDYIIVHGVYAWVPEPVRRALFTLIGRVLAPTGVAVVSYNALPGHVLSQTLRDMVDALLPDLPPGQEKTERAVALLRDYADGGKEGDATSLEAALRARARLLLDRPQWLLAHDEFGENFAPQRFDAVCAAAERVGLAYLNDTSNHVWEQGFPGDAVGEAALRRSIQIDDLATGCLFRHSMFVREGLSIRRSVDVSQAERMLLSCNAEQTSPGKFSCNGDVFEFDDRRMFMIVSEAIRRYPEPFPLAGMDEERLLLFVRLFLGNAVKLGTAPDRVGRLTERPRLNRLARAQIERGDTILAGLDHTAGEYSEDFRRLMLLLDGTRDAADLAAEVGFSVAEAKAFLGMVAHRAMLAP